jgi:quercetin dioxygenase-like cupin family protein
MLVALALAFVPLAATEVFSQGQGGGLPTAEDFNCPPAKRTATLRREQSAALAKVGDLTTLRNRADLGRLAQPPFGFSFPTHQFTSFRGIGLTFFNPTGLIGPGSPNFLFYAPRKGADATDPRGPDFPYELVGWGYGVPYAPDRIPGFLPCIGAEDWHIHERGVHDEKTGGMVVMPPAESSFGAAAGALSDPPALRPEVGFPHGRSWTAHFWRDGSGVAKSAILDPTDPPAGVDPGEGSSFYFPEEAPTGALDAAGSLGRPAALQQGEGRPAVGGGNEYTIKIQSFQTRGLFSLLEARLLRGGKPPVSGPLDHAEAYYILDGEVTFKADGQTLPGRAGSFVYIPEGSRYSFEVGGSEARALLLATPGGLENDLELAVPPTGLPPGAAPPPGLPPPADFELQGPDPKAYVLEPGEGTVADIRGSSYTIKAGNEATGGAFSFMEGAIIAGGVPPPHIHHREIETFYMLDGEMTFVSSGQYLPVQTGGTALLPIGALHAYTVDGNGTADVILISVPGGLDDYFIALAKAEGQPLSAEQAAAFAVEPVLPPGAGPPGG